MINENFKPAEWKYVETPYAEMLKHGMMQQANYDEAVNAMSEYDAKLGALKRIDEDTYQKVASKYDQDFRDMYDQYGGDWGAMKNRVKQRLGAETANPYYNLNRTHVEEYEKMMDLNRQLQANGQSPLTFSKVPLSLTKDNKLIKPEDIKYNIEGMLDWGKAEREVSDFALQEESNSGETSLANLTDDDITKIGNKLYLETVKTTTSGIGERQILNKINNMFTNFMDTKEGKQKYRALMNSEEFGIKGANPRLVEAKIKEDLLKTAYLKIHQSRAVDRQTIGNTAYGRTSGGGGSTKLTPWADLPSGNSDEQVKLPTNTFGRFLEYANKYQNDKSSINNELTKLDKDLVEYSKKYEKHRTPENKKLLDLAYERRGRLINDSEKIDKAIQFHRSGAINSYPALSKLANLVGFKLDPKDPKSVDQFFNIPGVVNAFNDAKTNRESYIGKRVPINNPQFEKVMESFIKGEPGTILDEDENTTSPKIKEGTKPTFEFISGSNKIIMKYIDDDGDEAKAITNRSKLPAGVLKELKAMDNLMEVIHDPSVRKDITIGGNTYRPIDGVDIMKYGRTSDGEDINPLEVYFSTSDGQVYSGSTLYSSGFTTLEVAGSITKKTSPIDNEQLLPTYPKQ